MTRILEPHLFLQIMQLPQHIRLDLLCFLGSVSMGPVETQKIVNEFAALQDDDYKMAKAG